MTQSTSIKGIHHITTISSSAQKTYDFYSGILGLKMVKKTVNFDAPDVYHLYFGDNEGQPGTILTFFPFEDASSGMRGTGQATKISFAVPKDSLGFWIERFIQKGVKYEKIKKEFGLSTIVFYDFDVLQLELVATDEEFEIKSWNESDIEKQHEIKGFYSVTISVKEKNKSEKILTELLDYENFKEDEFITRYINKNAKLGKYIDIFEMKGWPEGRSSAGTIHHVAFAIDDEVSQENFIKEIEKFDLNPTPIIDRNYFKSVYFREPGGVLFEIATIPPGFSVDEDIESLGKNLKLPEQYENIDPDSKVLFHQFTQKRNQSL